uniref:Gag-pol polyprotein n=1 Tax=Strongyloides venezuelensis TaxID=75913 RepID=A0A0K0F8S4_STRVS
MEADAFMLSNKVHKNSQKMTSLRDFNKEIDRVVNSLCVIFEIEDPNKVVDRNQNDEITVGDNENAKENAVVVLEEDDKIVFD